MDETISAHAHDSKAGDASSAGEDIGQPASARRFLRVIVAAILGLVAGIVAWALLLQPETPARSGISEPAAISAEPIAVSSEAIDHELPEEIHTAPVDEAIAVADEMLCVGDFRTAIRVYQSLKSRVAGNDASRLAYRAAVAAELAGEADDASRGFQSLLEGFADSSISKAAMLGRARLAVAGGRFRAAQGQLAGELLAAGATSLDTGRWVGEAAHLLAQSQAREVLLTSPQNLLEDQSPIVFPLLLNPTELLYLAEVPAADEERKATPGEPSVAIVHRFGPEPERTQVAVHLGEVPLADAIAQLAHHSGLRLVLSESAKRAMPGRSTTIHRPNMSLALILDRLLLPLDMRWRLDGRLLHVEMFEERTEDQATSYLQAAALRALQQASIAHPDHYLARSVELHLAMIQLQRGELKESVQNYTAFLKRNSRSRLRQAAWFNLAKAQLAMGDEVAAVDSFYHAIDNGRQTEIAHAAYLYIGRLKIELGQYDEAKRPLLMAIALATNSRIRELSVVALAASYALNDNDSAATAALVEYDRDLKASDIRRSAELVSQFVRYRDSDESNVVHAGTMLVTSLANSSPSGFLRSAEALIRDASLRDLGMLKQRVEFLKRFLEPPSNGSARQRLSLALADALTDLGQLSEAEQWLGEFIPEAKGPWLTQARIKQIQIIHQRGEDQRSMELCGRLIETASDKRAHKFALRVMGQLYQDQGDFQNASLCYAGILPPSTPTNEQRPGEGRFVPEIRKTTTEE